jgi:RNA polymerase sigma factor (sigma-70 family)
MGTQGDLPRPRDGTTRLLVDAATGGDPGAQGRLLFRFEPVLRSSLQRQLGRERFQAEGEDLLQEVRLAVVQGLRTFRGRDRASLVAWLRRVSLRKAIDWDRRRSSGSRGGGRRPRSLSATHAPEVAAASETPSQTFLRREELERALRALETLPEPYREVLRIVLTESPEPGELAARLGRGPEATRKLVSRAIEALRKALRVPPA